MERMTRTRVSALLLLFCFIVGFFGFKLYDMQIVSTGGSTNNITTFTTLTRVKAARGNILDSRGNVLVTNRASYDLVINHYVFTSSATPNETLLDLVELCRRQNIEYDDHLPLSKQAPFEYTLSDYNSTWQNYFQTFLAYRDNLDSDITAELLMSKLRSSYGIPESWNDIDARAVLAGGMSLEDGALFAEGLQLFHGEESLHGQCRVLCRAHVALGQNEAVTVFPLGVFRIHVHGMPVAGCHEVRYREGSAGMSGLCLIDHVDHILFEIHAFVFQFIDTECFFHSVKLLPRALSW